MFINKLILVYSVVLLTVLIVNAQKIIPQSGDYFSFSIATDREYFTGVMDEVLGENGNFVCQFYVSGKITGNTFRVQCRNAFDTGTVGGTVTVINDRSFMLKTDENPGCAMMIADFENKGETYQLGSVKTRLQIRMVQSKKAYFYTDTTEVSKRKAFLIQNDNATVTRKVNNWLFVTFNKTAGWMKEEDMFRIY